MSSLSSLPKTTNRQRENSKELSKKRNRTQMNNYQSELLSKYENESIPALTDHERKMLTQKALGSERLVPDERHHPSYLYSVVSDSVDNSSRVL